MASQRLRSRVRQDVRAFLGTPAQVRVLAFGVVLLGVGALLHAGIVVHLPVPDHPIRLPLILLAAAFYVTEAKVVHIEFRQEAQAFSLNEIPLMLGLFFVPPNELLLATLAGTLGALVITRRQHSVKLLFNCGHVWVSTATILIVFHTIGGTVVEPAPRSWIAALVAALAGTAISVVSIAAAISISEGRLHLERFPQVAALAALGTLTTASFGLMGVTLMWRTPSALWLLIVPAVAVYVALRAYLAEKQRHAGLEFLYESSRILHEYPEVEEAIRALLEEARQTFRCEIAEVTLFPGQPGEECLRSTVSEDVDLSAMAAVPRTELEARFARLVSGTDATLVAPRTERGEAFHDYVDARGLRDAMVAPLKGETRVIGAMLVANRLGQLTSFRDDDLRLFDTLANQASVSLEYGRLERTLSNLTDLKEQLRHQAYHDSLTGLANRALFQEHLDALATSAPAEAGRLAVLYLDLDDFKAVNDSLGHSVGDQVLTTIAGHLRDSLRPGDVAARLGGDEFAVLVRGMRQRGDVRHIAERILGALREPVIVGGERIRIRASVGIAINDHGELGEELVRKADIAMYEAKHTRKGRWAIYEPSMGAEALARTTLQTDVLRGVDGGEFIVHYQPLFDLRSGQLLGVEALSRWQHPDRGLVPPGEFLTVAEDSGAILTIGEDLIVSACRMMATLSEEVGRDLLLTVNISARQLKDPALRDTITEALRATGLRPHQLVLEITEHDLMDDSEASARHLAELKAIGIQLAIDDFGTGYSSLAYLRRFPIDIVKIARPFVEDIDREGDEGVLAQAIIGLSRSLGMRTIAEGIETEHQRQALAAWGCEIGQGFLVARPDSESEVRDLLREDVPRTEHVVRLIGADPHGT